MSNHDWKTISVILYRILTTKPLIFIKCGQAGGHTQERQGSPTSDLILS